MDELVKEIDIYVREKEEVKSKSNFGKLIDWFKQLW